MQLVICNIRGFPVSAVLPNPAEDNLKMDRVHAAHDTIDRHHLPQLQAALIENGFPPEVNAKAIQEGY